MRLNGLGSTFSIAEHSTFRRRGGAVYCFCVRAPRTPVTPLDACAQGSSPGGGAADSRGAGASAGPVDHRRRLRTGKHVTCRSSQNHICMYARLVSRHRTCRNDGLMLVIYILSPQSMVFTDRCVSAQRTAIGRVRPFVRPFPL